MHTHLRSFLEYLQLNRNASARTVRAYESDLRQFLSFLEQHLGRPADQITPRELDHHAIRGFMAVLYDRGNSRASSARRLAAIRSFGRYLRREQEIDQDPGALVATPKQELKVPARLEIPEVEALLAGPDASTPLGRRDRAILELFYASGLRLSELVGLELEDVNLGSRLVRVLGKGGKERILPFHRNAGASVSWRPRGAGAVRPGPCHRGALVPQLPGGTSVDEERRSPGAPIRVGHKCAVGHQSARAAALIRDPHARTWG